MQWCPATSDPDFETVAVEDGSNVIIVWLVPIGAREAPFIAEAGWPRFEEHLVKADPDLLDLFRAEIGPRSGLIN